MARKYEVLIHTCPACGSSKTNPVTDKNSFCKNCFIEFDFTDGKIFTILYDGSLVDHHENEFVNCG